MELTLLIVALVAVGLLVMIYLHYRRVEIVYPWELALLYVNGTFIRPLPAGRHAFSTLGRTVNVQRVAGWEVTFGGGNVDLLTADRFAARASPTVRYKVRDPQKMIESQFQTSNGLGLALAEALAAEVAKLTLDQLLAGLPDLAPTVLDALRGRFEEIEVTAVYVLSVSLPPETRRLTTEVERARLESLASLERARGEHAALRALANAARLTKENPDILRLRTLQVAAQAGKNATIILNTEPGTSARGTARGTRASL
jgi:regulator of protease activity HflC (stomatin/prohibitin superfamily)